MIQTIFRVQDAVRYAFKKKHALKAKMKGYYVAETFGLRQLIKNDIKPLVPQDFPRSNRKVNVLCDILQSCLTYLLYPHVKLIQYVMVTLGWLYAWC